MRLTCKRKEEVTKIEHENKQCSYVKMHAMSMYLIHACSKCIRFFLTFLLLPFI